MKDEEKTKEQLINELVDLRQRVAELKAPGTKDKRAEQAFPEKRIWLPMASLFVLLCILVWLDEIVDLPRLLLGAPSTPFNWQEAILEMTLIAAVGVFAVSNLVQVTRRKRAEEALRETSDYLEQLLDYANAPIIVWDTEFKIARFNHAFERLTGYAADQVIGQELHVLFPDTSRDESLNKIERTSSGEYWESVEIPILRQDGDIRLALWNSANIYAEDGTTLIATVAQGQDITERKRAEEALRESEEQLRTLLDAMPDFVCFKDGEGRWLEVNGASIRLFQLEGVNYRGKNDSELAELSSLLRDTFLTCKETDARTWEKRSLSRGEEMIPHPDGTVRVYDVIKVPVFFPDGERKGIVVLGRDVTERQQAEEEQERLLAKIQEQAQQVQQIIDTVPEGVLLLNADGQVALANPLGRKDLAALANASVGDTLTHLGGRPLAELLTPPYQGFWHEVALEGPPPRVFEIIAKPIEIGPSPDRWVMVIRDMTREREFQRHSQQQARLATVGQLAAGIAHDFNNIMATIILYAQILSQTEGLSPRSRERLATINQQARHATNLIQQILDFSRRAVLERQPMSLLPLLKEHVKLLERTLPENIEIVLAYGPDEYTVNADPTRVQQMVMNLVMNARDAMPAGGDLRFGLERIQVQPGESPPLPEMEPGEWVQVTVSDTGTGIPPDVLPRIFDPFFTTTPPGEGSGVGLAQVHGIVKQHEGEIGVQSPSTGSPPRVLAVAGQAPSTEFIPSEAERLRPGQMGHGTTFTIYLPALPVHPVEAPTLEPPALTKGQGETILVVEDDASTRQALVESLELLNYRPLAAADGREALDILERQTSEVSNPEVALVLSDVVMPGMGGIALFHALRQMGMMVKVVLTTGHPLEKEMERLRMQGLSDWLPKPSNLEQLSQVLARALEEG